MHYRTLAQFNDAIIRHLHRIPRDVDVIVGIPRSGLMAASLISLALNLPLADLDGFIAGRMLSSGKTKRRGALDRGMDDLRHALVVDDSVWQGTAMQEAREKLAQAPEHIKMTTCVVYGHEQARGLVDLMFEEVPLPRLFEWNLMHHDALANACVDIDGVLCHDPEEADNDDGDAYLAFLLNARPLHTPTKKIGALVTSRLEKYRKPTAEWLSGQGVDYSELIMLDLPDAEARRRAGSHARHKSEFYRKSRYGLFIESEPWQARQIAQRSGKPVICVGDQTLYDAASVALTSEPPNGSTSRRLARGLLPAQLRQFIRSTLPVRR